MVARTFQLAQKKNPMRHTGADIEESMLSPEILARVLLLPMHRTRQPNATSEDLLED